MPGMRKIDDLRIFLLTFRGAYEDLPFGPSVLVYKVGDKMFALVGWDEDPLRINLKCDPERALFLREAYSGVRPGYQMNKEHWNTVYLDGSVPDEEVRMMIGHSYELVFRSLPGRIREKLAGENETNDDG